jgi:hypothetical protein
VIDPNERTIWIVDAHIATTESVSSCASMINRLRFLNVNRRATGRRIALREVKPVYGKKTPSGSSSIQTSFRNFLSKTLEAL